MGTEVISGTISPIFANKLITTVYPRLFLHFILLSYLTDLYGMKTTGSLEIVLLGIRWMGEVLTRSIF